MTSATLVTIGVGLVTFGAAFGIGKLATAALEGMARKPEASKDIRGAMLVAAALIEGVAVISLVICILAIVLA